MSHQATIVKETEQEQDLDFLRDILQLEASIQGETKPFE